MNRKRFLLILIAVLILIGGIVMIPKLFKKSPYDKNGKLRKDITVEEILEIEAEHGDLLSASYSRGGGMEGDVYSLTVGKEDDGRVYGEVRTSPAHYIPVRVYRYQPDPKILDELKEYADRYHLSVWEDLPSNDVYAMDASSSSVSLIYDDSAIGGSEYEIYGISYDDMIPKGGMEILEGFTGLLGDAVKGDLIDTYLEADDRKIRTGREIRNSDEEIGLLLTGDWRSEKVIRLNALTGEKEEMICDGSHYYLLYFMAGYDEIELIGSGFDEQTKTYRLRSYVHDPLPDRDSSWYAEGYYEDAEIPETLMMTVEGDRLYMEKTYTYADSYVRETVIFTRN